MSSPGATVAVIGAGFAGLLAAAAAQRAGAAVVVLERDELTDDASERPGVPQGAQPHVLLHRGLMGIETLLPGLRTELLAAGGVPMDTGDLAWLSPAGWYPTGVKSYEIISLSRPLFELVVRRRVLGLNGVEVRTGARARSLTRESGRWRVACADNTTCVADTVVEASGRSSRLPHWLADLRIDAPEPSVLEARLGYATRRYRCRAPAPLEVGIVVAACPEVSTGALVLPVENNEWLVGEAGYGEHRPSRDTVEFEEYLRGLRDPVVSDFIQLLEPVDEVRIHRQTANRRQHYERVRGWPAGLLVVGDALTAFNPIYGQGITVAACQAERLGSALGHPLDQRTTRCLQRELARVADFPWAVATGEDLRYPTSDGRPSMLQRLLHRWTNRVDRLGVAGDIRCRTTLASIYHLMASPLQLFAPGIVVSVLRSLVRGAATSSPRPAVLAAVDARVTAGAPVSRPPAL